MLASSESQMLMDTKLAETYQETSWAAVPLAGELLHLVPS